MAERRVQLIAYSPRLDKVLKNLVKGIGVTDLNRQAETGRRYIRLRAKWNRDIPDTSKSGSSGLPATAAIPAAPGKVHRR